MKKKFAITLFLFSVTILSLMVVCNQNYNFINYVNANDNAYVLETDTAKNRFVLEPGYFSDGYTELKTNNGYPITFYFTKIKSPTKYWLDLLPGGGFINKTAIHGISSIKFTTIYDYEVTFDVRWSHTADFREYEKESIVLEAKKSVAFDFNSKYPTYFQVINTCEQTIAFKSMSIYFTCVNEYAEINATSENESYGYVDGAGAYRIGETVILTATPYNYHKFVGWYENGNLLSENQTFIFTASEDINIEARFEKLRYQLTVRYDPKQGNISGEGSYPYGGYCRLLATAKTGYSFVGWYSNGELLSTKEEYLFYMPGNDLILNALFEISFKINLSTSDNSLGFVIGPAYSPSFEKVTVNAICTNTNYTFAYWKDENDQIVSYSSSYTFIMPNTDITLIACFKTI